MAKKLDDFHQWEVETMLGKLIQKLQKELMDAEAAEQAAFEHRQEAERLERKLAQVRERLGIADAPVDLEAAPPGWDSRVSWEGE